MVEHQCDALHCLGRLVGHANVKQPREGGPALVVDVDSCVTAPLLALASVVVLLVGEDRPQQLRTLRLAARQHAAGGANSAARTGGLRRLFAPAPQRTATPEEEVANYLKREKVDAPHVQRDDAAAALELRKLQMERTLQQRAAGAVVSRVRRARNAAEARDEEAASARGASRLLGGEGGSRVRNTLRALVKSVKSARLTRRVTFATSFAAEDGDESTASV